MTIETQATLENIGKMSTETLKFELTEAKHRASNGDVEAKTLVDAITKMIESRE